ncbi:hypothetical protein F4805DRAFT_462139 [Annulohypoxylon moriforme]|nr:hypothetical protein F4805DRAFT_462139 [Annulohypoxylon moriforme]
MSYKSRRLTPPGECSDEDHYTLGQSNVTVGDYRRMVRAAKEALEPTNALLHSICQIVEPDAEGNENGLHAAIHRRLKQQICDIVDDRIELIIDNKVRAGEMHVPKRQDEHQDLQPKQPIDAKVESAGRYLTMTVIIISILAVLHWLGALWTWMLPE